MNGQKNTIGGEEVFEVEHFKPRGKFPHLDCVYGNLYYVCRKCNAHKSETWPSEEQLARGLRFVDPCEEDPYIRHFLRLRMEVSRAGQRVGLIRRHTYACITRT